MMEKNTFSINTVDLISNQTLDNRLFLEEKIKEVGGYRITGKHKKQSISFMFTKKPNFIHRLFCRALLGWIWFDEN